MCARDGGGSRPFSLCLLSLFFTALFSRPLLFSTALSLSQGTPTWLLAAAAHSSQTCRSASRVTSRSRRTPRASRPYARRPSACTPRGSAARSSARWRWRGRCGSARPSTTRMGHLSSIGSAFERGERRASIEEMCLFRPCRPPIRIRGKIVVGLSALRPRPRWPTDPIIARRKSCTKRTCAKKN